MSDPATHIETPLPEPPGAEPPASLTLTKAELLAEVERLRVQARDYGALMDRFTQGESAREETVARFRADRERLEAAGLPESRTGLVLALARHLVRRLGADPLRFRLPSRIGGFAARENPALLDYSNLLREHSGPLEAKVAEVATLAEEAVARGEENLAALLAGVASLFKALLRQDWSDVRLLLSHINLTTSTRERQELVRRIAGIARDIYHSLHAFSQEIDLQGLYSRTEEIPDAVGKLRSVIGHLEQAANANLDGLERLEAQNRDNQRWAAEALAVAEEGEAELERITADQPDLAGEAEILQTLLRERITAPLRALDQEYRANQEDLLNIIANQSFQDLTGQTLEKVIHLVESLQFQLVELLQRHSRAGQAGPAQPPAPPAAPAATDETEAVAAPEAPPAKQSQEDVDRLLTELGF